MRRSTILTTVVCLLAIACNQQDPELTIADYERAESFLYGKRENLVSGTISNLSWQKDGNLIFSRTKAEGKEYLKLDIATRNIEEVFELSRVVESLAEFETALDIQKISLNNIREEDGKIKYSLNQASYETDLSDYQTKVLANEDYTVRNSITSPGEKRAQRFTMEN